MGDLQTDHGVSSACALEHAFSNYGSTPPTHLCFLAPMERVECTLIDKVSISLPVLSSLPCILQDQDQASPSLILHDSHYWPFAFSVPCTHTTLSLHSSLGSSMFNLSMAHREMVSSLRAGTKSFSFFSSQYQVQQNILWTCNVFI